MPVLLRLSALALLAGALALPALGSPARAELLIEIDKTSQRMRVTREGVPLHVWPVSTGRPGHDTPSGAFTPFRLEVDHYSEEWDNAPMPHSIFFTKRGHAIHGSYEVKKLGTAASAGCVRLAPQNAETLFKLVKAEGLANVRVAIGGEVPRRMAPDAVARAPQAIDPRRYEDEADGRRYIYRDRDSRYPDPYDGARGDPYAQRDPNYGYRDPYARAADPRSGAAAPRYYYDAYGRLRYVQPAPPLYWQRRGYGYGWD